MPNKLILSQAQLAITSLSPEQSALVYGAVGTGKTCALLMLANNLAGQSKSVLFLTYTRALANSVKRNDLIMNAGVTVNTIHTYFRSVIEKISGMRASSRHQCEVAAVLRELIAGSLGTQQLKFDNDDFDNNWSIYRGVRDAFSGDCKPLCELLNISEEDVISLLPQLFKTPILTNELFFPMDCRAIRTGQIQHVDHLLIDETQDFPLEVLKSLKTIARKSTVMATQSFEGKEILESTGFVEFKRVELQAIYAESHFETIVRELKNARPYENFKEITKLLPGIISATQGNPNKRAQIAIIGVPSLPRPKNLNLSRLIDTWADDNLDLLNEKHIDVSVYRLNEAKGFQYSNIVLVLGDKDDVYPFHEPEILMQFFVAFTRLGPGVMPTIVLPAKNREYWLSIAEEFAKPGFHFQRGDTND